MDEWETWANIVIIIALNPITLKVSLKKLATTAMVIDMILICNYNGFQLLAVDSDIIIEMIQMVYQHVDSIQIRGGMLIPIPNI